MNPTLARWFSVVFHPLLMPSYLFCLLLYLLPESVSSFPLAERWRILVLVAVLTFIMPALATYTLVRHGIVDSVEMHKRQQRQWPLLITVICYSFLTYMLYTQLPSEPLFYYIMAIITLSVYLTFMVNIFWQISAHSIGMGGALGILILLQSLLSSEEIVYVIVGWILLSSLVLSARLALHAHRPAEVYTGFLAGFSIGAGMLLAGS